MPSQAWFWPVYSFWGKKIIIRLTCSAACNFKSESPYKLLDNSIERRLLPSTPKPKLRKWSPREISKLMNHFHFDSRFLISLKCTFLRDILQNPTFIQFCSQARIARHYVTSSKSFRVGGNSEAGIVTTETEIEPPFSTARINYCSDISRADQWSTKSWSPQVYWNFYQLQQ